MIGGENSLNNPRVMGYSTKEGLDMVVGAGLAKATQVGETEVALGKLKNEIVSLFKQVGDTEDRLSPILRPTGETCNDKVSPEFSTQLAQEINNSVRDLGTLNERISDLRNRIEL